MDKLILTFQVEKNTCCYQWARDSLLIVGKLYTKQWMRHKLSSNGQPDLTLRDI